ncbi:MAG: hypothetical protein EZS28_033136, partial [Streblomastix strix]
MATTTGTKFVKSGFDSTVVLLGASDTKLIFEFAGTPTDLSDYYTKTQIYSKTETDNKYVRLESKIQQAITGRLKYVSSFGQTNDETQIHVADTYLSMSEVDSKLTNYVNTTNSQEINGTMTFNANVNATGFVKTGMDDISVLLAGGGDRLLSSFEGIDDLTSSVFSIQDDVAVTTYIPFPNSAIDKGDYAMITHSNPIGEIPQPVPTGDQTLQQQVKNNDDIIYASNELFEPPVPNAIPKLDLSSQLERSSFLASSGSDPQLIVYGDRITLIASYATTGLFPNGYLFKSYPQEARPKAGDQVIALVGTDASNTHNIFCYIDQIGQYFKINYDANNDGKIDIKDSWNVNGKGQLEAQSYVYETIKKQTDLIEAGGQQKFSAISLFKDIQDKSSAVQVAVSGQLNMFDCKFQGTYIIDNYTNSTNTNESAPEDVESHISEFVINYFFPSSAYNTFYIVDDGTCR